MKLPQGLCEHVHSIQYSPRQQIGLGEKSLGFIPCLIAFEGDPLHVFLGQLQILEHCLFDVCACIGLF
jgi:hypothetical protein